MHCVKIRSDVKDVVMCQVFLQIILHVLPIDIQEISQKTTLHYLNTYITNQNKRYLLAVLHFGKKIYQTPRKDSKKCLYLIQN